MSGFTRFGVKEIRELRNGNQKHPFPHQLEAFSALAKTFPTPISGYKGTLLVLPTGAGKTFTAVNWICRNIVSKGTKVLWLAQSSYLLDQAARAFHNEIHSITGRDSINIRVVSSSEQHSNAGSIVPSDDVIICTTQTAIRAYATEAKDINGNKLLTPFKQYLNLLSEDELFVVVDEAHHTPAYGCRNLLTSLRDTMQNLYILGLTATPYHSDKRISGWLRNIYDQWICYQADMNVLQTNSILSVPKYIEKQTGIEFEVDDKLYKRLTSKHKDLPEYIIEKLANDASRNNYIVSDYINNKEAYGKTIIFADRWFQCEYIVEKLKSQGVRANAVYSKIENSDALFKDGRGRRGNKDNEEIMQDFRNGEYDVIVNVKMLTEGVDVPDVKTVMITRQTTSPILFTQMVGRALRGKKAGGGEGKDFANIVLFMDHWKRLLPFVSTEPKGGIEDIRPDRQGRSPYDTISIQLVKKVSEDITYEIVGTEPYLSLIPVGWYATEYTASIEESGNEEYIACMESLVIYDFNHQKYEALIENLLLGNLENWADERLEDEELMPTVISYANQFFIEDDNLDGNLNANIINLIRHIAQNGTRPEFVNFNQRNVYDLDKIAEELIDTSPRECNIRLKNLFNNEGRLWKILYGGNFNYFKKAFDNAINRILNGYGSEFSSLPPVDSDDSTILTEEIKQQVLKRDNYQCLCCGKERRRGVSLEIDHILPVTMGGKNVPSNLQTLCKQCNGIKGVNEIDYHSIISPLRAPKEMVLFDCTNTDDMDNFIARVVNHIYHCRAFCSLVYSTRKNGRYYNTWQIDLYNGNNPEWIEKYIPELLEYINHELGWDNVKDIVVKG
jgi:superfamily II DNA or RNA helicase